MTEFACPECQDSRAFVMPLCDEGHEFDCPDRVCAECGFAVFLGSGPLAVDVVDLDAEPARAAA